MPIYPHIVFTFKLLHVLCRKNDLIHFVSNKQVNGNNPVFFLRVPVFEYKYHLQHRILNNPLKVTKAASIYFSWMIDFFFTVVFLK